MMALDAADSPAFASCFTEDGSCEIKLTGGLSTGRVALEGLCDALHGKFGHLRHWEGNVTVVEGDGDTLHQHSYWKALRGGECVATGVHRDVMVESDGAWLIKQRIIEHTWRKPQ